MTGETGGKQFNRFDRAVGAVSANLAERILLRRVEYQGTEHIAGINNALAAGGSALVVPDHADLINTMYSANFMLMLHAAKRGVVMTQAYESGQMGNVGRVALRIVDHYGAEPIFVMTKKYVPDYETRNQYNEGQKEVIKGFLRQPGHALLMYPEGTRQYEMGEARRGFAEFAPEAGIVVPLTTIAEKGERPRVIIHEPIASSGGIQRCVELYGEEVGKQAFTDLIMTIIASGQPNEQKRGVYRDMAADLERFLLGFSGNVPQQASPRSQRVIEAYMAWKAGEFGG